MKRRALDIAGEIQGLFDHKEYFKLKQSLARCDLGVLSENWSRLSSMQKAALFKLLAPAKAMDLYRMVEPSEKYFLLTAFDLGSIAPILEPLPPKTKGLFHRLPDECYDEMLQLIK